MQHTSSPSRALGFSLVELMVGIVVAMAAVVVVMQVFKVSENQRRGTTGGDDAQTTGAIALSQLERDLRQAGQGFISPSLLDCQLNLGNGHSLTKLAPVIINPAGVASGDDNTDTLLISYGSAWGSPEGQPIITQSGAAAYEVSAPQAFHLGDRVIAATASRSATCTLDLTSLSATPVGNTVNVTLGTANVANGTLFTLGSTPRFIAYAVRSGRLTACDFLTQDCSSGAATNWSEVADNIISLRAEYAVDTSVPRDGAADTYSQTPSSIGAATYPWCPWARNVGVRLVLVARSRQPEAADIPGAAAPTWAGSASTPVTPSGDDWKQYRYKTFETTVPLRNTPNSVEPAFSSC